jgi:hypothetical protein
MKRLIAGPLWLLSIWYLFELLWVLFGVPRLLGPVVATAVAAGVWIDPMHWFWPARPSRPAANLSASTLQASAK